MQVYSSAFSGRSPRKSGFGRHRGPRRPFRFPLIRILALVGLIWLAHHLVFAPSSEESASATAASAAVASADKALAKASKAKAPVAAATSPGAPSPSASPAAPPRDREARAASRPLPAGPTSPCDNLFRVDRASLGKGRTRYTYHFLADSAVWSCVDDTARVPAQLRDFVVEGLLASQELRQTLDMRFAVAPNGQAEAWSWSSGPEWRSYRLDGENWVDSSGCARGMPCPWRNFAEQKGVSLPGARWRPDLGKGKPVYSFLGGQVVEKSQTDGAWNVTVHHPPEIYAQWSGLRLVRPGVRVGGMVDAGTPLGASGDSAPTLRVWMHGKPVDPVLFWRKARPGRSGGTEAPDAG